MIVSILEYEILLPFDFRWTYRKEKICFNWESNPGSKLVNMTSALTAELSKHSQQSWGWLLIASLYPSASYTSCRRKNMLSMIKCHSEKKTMCWLCFDSSAVRALVMLTSFGPGFDSQLKHIFSYLSAYRKSKGSKISYFRMKRI